MPDDPMKKLIEGLTLRLRRLPTEDEVQTFIFGDEEQRKAVLNGALPPSEGGS